MDHLVQKEFAKNKSYPINQVLPNALATHGDFLWARPSKPTEPLPIYNQE